MTNLKNLHPDITFTYVISSLQEGAIFLDTFISTYNNNLSIGIYRKPTHSNRVLNFYSNHTMPTKLGVAIGQFKRVQQICNNTKTLADGEEIIRETLKNSNYPINVIEKAYSISKTKKKKEEDVSFKDFVVLRLPFVNNQTTNVIKRELRKLKLDYAIRPIFYTGLHLSDILIRSNLPSTSEPRQVISQTVCDICCKNNCICHIRRVIYSIQCNMCLNNNCNDKSNTGTYIGETGRLLKFRINEHKKALLKEDISNSAMAAHFKLLHADTAVCNKTFTVNILDKCNGFLDWKILEAYHIINCKPDLNRNTGLFLTT